MKKKSIAALIGIGMGVVLILMGLITTGTEDVPSIPNRELPSMAQTVRYVGGDAYNFLIEASIRGGEIAGATTAQAISTSGAQMTRAIYISAGMLSITVSIIVFATELDKTKPVKKMLETTE